MAAADFTRTRTFRWRLPLLLVLVVLIVLLPNWMSRRGTDDALEASRWVAHTAEVRSDIYELTYGLRDIEASAYAAVLGVAPGPMTRRVAAERKRVGPLLDELRGLVRDNPQQQSRLRKFDALVQGRLTLLDQALQQARRKDTEAARKTLVDARSMFAYRDLASEIVATEDQLLQHRRALALRRRNTASWIVYVATGAQLLLLAIVIFLSEKQLRQRLAAERRVKGAEGRAQMVLQTVRDPMAVLDEAFTLLTVNPAFCELYGVDPERAGKCTLQETGDGAWDNAALLQRLADVAARGRELWDYELAQETADGVERDVIVNARRMELPQSEEVVMLLTVSDISARKRAEDQALELNEQLEGKVEQLSDVNRELEAFSYSISHDLRAPLRHIAGFSDKLGRHLGEQADEKVTHYLEVIREASSRMAALIDDLLVYSRLGRGALRLQRVDMQSLVDEARSLASENASSRDIDWRIDALPVVVADANMMRQVWQNLLGNAVKYTARREQARIEVKCERRRSQRGEFVFTVRDNGAGFDMRYAGKLFGVFQRLHKASDYPGTGIGLANVRRIIARHGGRTWAEGEVDRGASFSFSLPAGTAVSAERGEDAQDREMHARGDGQA